MKRRVAQQRERRLIRRILGNHRRWEWLAEYEGPETGQARVIAAYDAAGKRIFTKVAEVFKDGILESAFREGLFPKLLTIHETAELEGWVSCPTCGGSGDGYRSTGPDPADEPCESCEGFGKVPEKVAAELIDKTAFEIGRQAQTRLISIATDVLCRAFPKTLASEKPREKLWPYEYGGSLEDWRRWCAERNDPKTLAEVEACFPLRQGEWPGPVSSDE